MALPPDAGCGRRVGADVGGAGRKRQPPPSFDRAVCVMVSGGAVAGPTANAAAVAPKRCTARAIAAKRPARDVGARMGASKTPLPQGGPRAVCASARMQAPMQIGACHSMPLATHRHQDKRRRARARARARVCVRTRACAMRMGLSLERPCPVGRTTQFCLRSSGRCLTHPPKLNAPAHLCRSWLSGGGTDLPDVAPISSDGLRSILNPKHSMFRTSCATPRSMSTTSRSRKQATTLMGPQGLNEAGGGVMIVVQHHQRVVALWRWRVPGEPIQSA